MRKISLVILAEAGHVLNRDWLKPAFWSAAIDCSLLNERVIIATTKICDSEKRDSIRSEMAQALSSTRSSWTLIFPLGDLSSKPCAAIDYSAHQKDSTFSSSHLEPGLRLNELRLIGTFPDTNIVASCANATHPPRWLLKLDDDLTVNFAVIDQYLTSFDASVAHLNDPLLRPATKAALAELASADFIANQNYRFFWIGNQIVGNAIQRNGRNAEQLLQNRTYYPEYMSGPFYIMGFDTASVLVHEAIVNNTIYNNEDAMLGILAENLKFHEENVVILNQIHEPYIVTALGYEQPGIVCEKPRTPIFQAEQRVNSSSDRKEVNVSYPCHPDRVLVWPGHLIKGDGIPVQDPEASPFSWIEHTLKIIVQKAHDTFSRSRSAHN